MMNIRLGRLGYLLRLFVVLVLYGIGSLLVAAGGKGESLNPVALVFLFFGSGILLLALLSYWISSVRRLHDMGLSGWWFLLQLVFPPAVLVVCVWPGERGFNRFGPPAGY